MATANASEKKKKASRKQQLINAPTTDCSGRCGKGGLLKGEGNNDMEVFHREQQSPITTDDLPLGSLSAAISVSGIISRYFTNFTELDEICSPLKIDLSSEGKKKLVKQNRDAKNMCPISIGNEHVSLCRTTHNEYERSEVGARLLTAADGLRLCQTNQESPVSNLCTGLKFLRPDVDSIAQNLVYEIGC